MFFDMFRNIAKNKLGKKLSPGGLLDIAQKRFDDSATGRLLDKETGLLANPQQYVNDEVLKNTLDDPDTYDAKRMTRYMKGLGISDDVIQRVLQLNKNQTQPPGLLN